MQMQQEASEVRLDIMKVQLQMLMNKVLIHIKDWVAQQSRTRTLCTT
jgi:hypothetical protein